MSDDPFGDLAPLWRAVVYGSMLIFGFVVLASFVDAEFGGGQYRPDVGIYTLIGSVIGGVFSAQLLIELLKRRKP